MSTTPWTIEGKVCLITGATSGIGRESALELARRGARLRLACRSEERTQVVIDAIRAEVGSSADVAWLPLELGSLAAVRRCAELFLERDEPLHVLVHNAGLASWTGKTHDGFEKTFGVNQLGPFLLQRLLEKRLLSSAPARVVIVASHAHYRARAIDFDRLRDSPGRLSIVDRYAASKLKNVLFARELAARLDPSAINVSVLHPGRVATDVWRMIPWPIENLIKLFMTDSVRGAQTTIHCASAPDIEHGGYYDDHQRVRYPSRVAQNAELAKRLWQHCEELIAPFADPIG